MIELWIGLVLLTIAALFFLFWPILSKSVSSEYINRKEENIENFKHRLAELKTELNQGLLTDESYRELALDLEKSLLVDASISNETVHINKEITSKRLLIMSFLALLLIVTTMFFYAKYGNYKNVVMYQNLDVVEKLSVEKTTFEEAITLLEKELLINPNNPKGWYVLAGNYMKMGAFDKGANAFAQVVTFLPEDDPEYANVLGQYAQALFFIENKVTAKVKEQANRALNIDDKEVISLGLFGIEAFENQQYEKAIFFWEKSLANAEHSANQALQSGIDKAREELLKQRNNAIIEKKINKNKLKVVVDVEIPYEVKNKIDKNAVLFVFARAIGGKVPVAAIRLSVSEIPARVILDDSSAMMPDVKISMQKQVEVSARVSLNGLPQRQIGDYESDVMVLKVSTDESSYKLLINKVVKE